MLNIAITGGGGFIAKNLIQRLSELGISGSLVSCLFRDSSEEEWISAINAANIVIHLAGTNRAKSDDQFIEGNVNLAHRLNSLLRNRSDKVRVFFSSSTQANSLSTYGATKLRAERMFEELSVDTHHEIQIVRLPNVFGKWCKPFYNSVVATYCHSLMRGREIEVNPTNPTLSLLYIDTLADAIIDWIFEDKEDFTALLDSGVYEISLFELAATLRSMISARENCETPDFSSELNRHLYSTLIAYAPADAVVTEYSSNSDSRGVFSELIKSELGGQFAFLTSKPGVVRGNHYHNAKVERFIVVSGEAKFNFKCIQTGKKFSHLSKALDGKIIETPPGYSHNIENTGDEDLLVILWANEIFEPDRPDTYYHEIN